MKKTDKLLLDGRKKCWIYEHGILPYLCWDFAMVQINTTAMDKMEAIVNKHLKKWLRLNKCANTTILYRGTCGLNITNIRNAITSSRCNTEIILCTSKDPLVRSTAKRRREEEWLSPLQNVAKRIKTAVSDLEFQKAFCSHIRSAKDKRGFGSPGDKKVRVNKKSIRGRMKELMDEEKVSKILSLAIQSKWTSWDELIQVDLKWNEIMYGYSPSLLSFWLNSIQDTLPDPVNLQRWGKSVTSECGLCKWKNCTLQHILCSCKVALDEGRISFRHDSVLGCIAKGIKEKMMEEKGKKKTEPTPVVACATADIFCEGRH